MIIFKDWTITAPRGVIARQYDNLSRRLEVVGELPEGYTWDLLVQVGNALDIITLEPMEGGVGVTLTADQLSQSGYYSVQLRGTRGEEVRHTNVESVFIPASLSGSGQWPTVPSEFIQAEQRIREIAGHPPVPGENGFWMLWDPDADQYAESQLPLPEGGGGGTSDHTQLSNRDAVDQHPMSSITGLEAALRSKQPAGDYLTDQDIDATLKEAGKAADAAAVGDRLSSLSEEIANISSGGSGGNGADYSFLTGLKYYACGDSIVDIQGTLTAPETFGDSGYSTDLQGRSIGEVTAEGYVTEIERRYGLVATNCGNSGHTLVQDYASLAAKDYSDVALVTIAYGCNDARTNVPLGTVNSTDVTTFAGALNQLLRKIYTDNPECRVIVLTPIQRLYVSDFGIGTANANGNYLVDFVDMSKKVAAKRSTKCIDMYRDCGINQTNLYYYTVEGVHPVNQGFARMKGAIIPVLDDMFALEYEPFGTMTNTGGTEPDEPDTGGDSGGDTPPEEEPGPNVVDLSGLFVLTGFYWDPWGAFKSDANVAGNDHPGVALEGGHTYTLTTYLPCSADATWGYGGAIADNPSMNPAGGTTLSFGKAVGTFEVVTINGSYYGKCSYTFTIDAGKTNYLYTARAANLDDSYVSLTYI